MSIKCIPEMRAKTGSIYADLYVKRSHRARRLPTLARPWRPRVIAWAGPAAFYRNRFILMSLVFRPSKSVFFIPSWPTFYQVNVFAELLPSYPGGGEGAFSSTGR